MFDDGPARRQIALEHGEGADGLERRVHGADDGLSRLIHHGVDGCADGAAVNRGRRAIELVPDFLEQGLHPAGAMELGHIVLPRRLQIDEQWDALAELIEQVHVELEAQSPTNGSQMYHGISRATHGLQGDEGVPDGAGSKQFAHGEAAITRQAGGFCAGRFGKARAFGIRCGGGPRLGQAEAHDFGEIGHGAGRAHDGAGADGGNQLVVDLDHFGFIDLAGAEASPHATAIGAGAKALALVVAGFHWPRGQEDRGNFARGGSHDLGGQGLVTSPDQHDAVHRLGADHFLGFHRHQIAEVHRGRRGETLVNGDGRKDHGQRAIEHDAALHRFDQLRDVAVAGIVVGIGIGNADDRPIEGVVGIAHGLDECLAQKQGEPLIAIAGQLAPQPAGQNMILPDWALVYRRRLWFKLNAQSALSIKKVCLYDVIGGISAQYPRYRGLF